MTSSRQDARGRHLNFATIKTHTLSETPHPFPRISRPVELLRHEYDVVVIGSGYGGGVAASRMARAGQSVCLLERGKEKWPGEYPSKLDEAISEVHVSGDFQPDNHKAKSVDAGDPTGLYHLIVGEGQNVFVANGLGGTSLLNANVFLRTDPKTQAMKIWPKELRDPGELAPYYDRAARMLEPEPYPEEFPELPKLSFLEKQSKGLGLGKFYRVPQTTRFHDGPNSTGVEMKTSKLTGQDCTGLNDWSKSSTLVNYISDAWNWGAEIFCECEVRYISERPSGGWNVFFAWHSSKRNKFSKNIHSDLMWVHAKKMVFLGAGTLGTTEILLRSKQFGLEMSSNVGTGMSGNGDILAFGYNVSHEVNGMGREEPPSDRPVGPTITGVIDCRDQENPLDGYVIEEGAIPSSLAPILQPVLDSLPGKVYPTNNTFVTELRRRLAGLGSLVRGPYYAKGSMEHTQTYLIMSHDSNQAILTMNKDKPFLRFLGVGRSAHVQHLNNVLADMTNLAGGTFINNPFYNVLGQQEITVHPIGGACISSNGTGMKGATTHFGEVFKGDGSDYHDGLVVVDGAAIPTALGVNPFATITALAERSVEGVAKKKSMKIDFESKNGILDLFGKPENPYPWDDDVSVTNVEKIIQDAKTSDAGGISFTEVMSGHIFVGSVIHEEFETAAMAARNKCQSARFYLSVRSWDLETLISGAKHSATITGTFSHGALPASPYMVLRGTFGLYVTDENRPDTKELTYDFDMVGTDGSILHFRGHKRIDLSIAGSLFATWRATTTLYVTLTDPSTNKLVSRGMMDIEASDFSKELDSIVLSRSKVASNFQIMSRFAGYFAKQVLNSFMGPFGSLQFPTWTSWGNYVKSPPNEVYPVTASDGIQTEMQYWEPAQGTTKSPINMLLIPGACVDHQIFAMPTLQHNAVETFTKAGYPVFCIVPRFGLSEAAQVKDWTAFDARLDIQAALETIRRLQNSSEKVYVLAHCAGSLALSCGILDGTIPGSWIKGITASQLFFNPIFPKINKIKAGLPIQLTTAYNILTGTRWYSCTSSRDDKFVQRLMNQLLRFYSVGSKSELCNSVVCHRIELAFGRLWSHKNLNSATHSQLERFFGGISTRAISHLVESGVAQEVLSAPRSEGGKSLVTEENLSRFRGIPIYFMSGSENQAFSPETTERSYATLRDLFGPDDYQRRVFQGRGHLDTWMSDRGNADVFPSVVAHANSLLFPELN